MLGGGGVAAMGASRPGGGGGVPQSRAWAGGGVTVWGQLVRLPPGFEANGVPHWPPQPVRGVQGCPAAGGETAMGSILGGHGATREEPPNDTHCSRRLSLVPKVLN